MNREMPLCALQKGSVFMSEKTSGMLAHPNTSAASADGLRKARAAYEACFCHIFLPHKFKPLISIRATGSISCVNTRTHLPAPCPYIFSYSFISLQRYMLITESENWQSEFPLSGLFKANVRK